MILKERLLVLEREFPHYPRDVPQTFKGFKKWKTYLEALEPYYTSNENFSPDEIVMASVVFSELALPLTPGLNRFLPHLRTVVDGLENLPLFPPSLEAWRTAYRTFLPKTSVSSFCAGKRRQL